MVHICATYFRITQLIFICVCLHSSHAHFRFDFVTFLASSQSGEKRLLDSPRLSVSVRSVAAELLHGDSRTDGETDIGDETNSAFRNYLIRRSLKAQHIPTLN